MQLWAVRHSDDKQAVGFFWAVDTTHLRYMVDNVTDVPRCEARAISDGCAVTWEGLSPGLGVKRRMVGDECADWAELSRQATFCFGFEPFLFDELTEGWQPL